MFIRAYLRASTSNQDSNRAKDSLISFAESKEHRIASFYSENESGRLLKRPKLMQLLDDSTKGDILLVESIDRLTRLTSEQWETLKLIISQKGLKIVALDVPTSHTALETKTDSTSENILRAVNNMLIDILATIACKDYEQRRERAAQGILKAKENGMYKGRPENKERNAGILKMLKHGSTYTEIQKATGASRATIAKLREKP